MAQTNSRSVRGYCKFYKDCIEDLLAYAEHELSLGQKGKDGKTLRETLEVVERITGKKPQDLINPVDLPEFLTPLWQDFISLNQTRQSGMSAQPISYLEIDAYSRLMQKKFSKFDVITIKRLDALSMKEFNKE